jgi:hypothetical protein
MATGDASVPDDLQLDRPNVARMWDYYLGGAHNFAVDRQAAEQILRLHPEMPMGRSGHVRLSRTGHPIPARGRD